MFAPKDALIVGYEAKFSSLCHVNIACAKTHGLYDVFILQRWPQAQQQR